MNIHADKKEENKSQTTANTSSKKKNNTESVSQLVDNRAEAVAQRKLQETANNSADVKQLMAFKNRINTNDNVIQRMFTQNNVPISTLTGLNSELALPAYSNKENTRPIILPIALAHFNKGQTAAELDTAISNSNITLYDYIEVSEIWDSIDAELGKITAPPVGYSLLINGNFSAFIMSAITLTDQQKKLFVNAANNQGNAVHQSDKTTNMSALADAYIHDYVANAIFSYQNMGTHRGVPMVKVLQQGKVNNGQHNF